MLFEYHSNQNAIGSERLLNISIFRVISMLMIVLFHCMCYCAGIWSGCASPDATIFKVATYVVSLALPFFFFISGYLYSCIHLKRNRYRKWTSFVMKKSERLLYPTVTWTIICLIILPNHYSLGELISGICHLWFLPTLFCIFVMAHLASSFLLAKRKLAVDTAIIISLIVGTYLLSLFLSSSRLQDFYLPEKVLGYMAYFGAGMVLFKYCFVVFTNKPIEVTIIVLLLCCHAVLTNFAVFRGQMLLDSIVIILICYLMLDYLSVVMTIGENNRLLSIFNNLDKNGMGIYLIHQVIIMTLYRYTTFEESWLCFHPYLGSILQFIIVFPLSWAFSETKRRLKLEPYI